MQYHYVVIFDTDKNDWIVEQDPFDYFPNGNIWDDDHGWRVADEGSDEERIDYECFRVLESCIPGILPTPSKEV